MIVECPKCKQKYKVNEKLIPVGGASVRCPSCSNIFTIYHAPLDIPLEPVTEETTSTFETSDITQQEVSKEPDISEPIEEPVTTEESSSISQGIKTTIPPVEERTKLWEKLQESYKSSKKETPVVEEETEEIPSIKEEDLKDAFTHEPITQEETEETATLEPSSETVTEEFTSSGPSLEIPTIEETPHIEEETPSISVEEEAPASEEEKVEKEAKRLARSLVKDILLYHGDKVEIGLRQGNLAQLIGDEIRKSWKFYKDSYPLEKTGGVNFFKNALNEIIGKGKPIFK